MTAAATVPTSLDSILDQLDQYHQRATYGAVAAIVNSSPRSLMTGRGRDPRSSWIVNRGTGEPTGYTLEQTHPSLKEREKILDHPEVLRTWLQDPA
jgi:hypothetical protein